VKCNSTCFGSLPSGTPTNNTTSQPPTNTSRQPNKTQTDRQFLRGLTHSLERPPLGPEHISSIPGPKNSSAGCKRVSINYASSPSHQQQQLFCPRQGSWLLQLPPSSSEKIWLNAVFPRLRSGHVAVHPSYQGSIVKRDQGVYLSLSPGRLPRSPSVPRPCSFLNGPHTPFGGSARNNPLNTQ
jgi:hypothetical protein